MRNIQARTDNLPTAGDEKSPGHCDLEAQKRQHLQNQQIIHTGRDRRSFCEKTFSFEKEMPARNQVAIETRLVS